jgi:hypothetical protein
LTLVLQFPPSVYLDHQQSNRYWRRLETTQLIKPAQTKEIIGRLVTYFISRFWNKEVIPRRRRAGYQMAYILSSAKRRSDRSLYTIRRMIVSGTTSGIDEQLQLNFNKWFPGTRTV